MIPRLVALPDSAARPRFVDVGGGLGVNYDVPENEPIPNFASLFITITFFYYMLSYMITVVKGKMR